MKKLGQDNSELSCLIELEYYHNHHTQAGQASSYDNIPRELSERVFTLFSLYYTPSSAYKEIIKSLRYHKKRHNFLDTPSDKCPCNHGIEDSNHFLFFCSLYVSQRATLMSSVIDILQKFNLNHLQNQSHLFLYGHRNINFADNRNILLSTIKFIKDTRRFSS